MRGEKRSETDGGGRGGSLGGVGLAGGWGGGGRREEEGGSHSPARLLRAQGKSGINVD